jgi:hypothetical protein
MAVEAGYSKIATSGSVFIYDTGDTINSYVGEPTTNQYTNPAFTNGTTGWTFGSWDSGNFTYSVENVLGPFGQIIPALKITRTGTSTYAHFHQNNSGKYTTGNQYTLSAYVIGAGTLRGNSQWGDSVNFTLSSQWQRVNYTVTAPNNSSYPYWAAEAITQNVPMYFVFAQSEQKSHVTPYVNGTRSNTQGLLDISGGGNTITLSNMTYDASAQPVFDGTDDYINVGSLNLQQNWTLEAICYMTSDSSFGIFGQGITNTNQGLHILYTNGSRGMIYGMYANDNDYQNNYRPTTGRWYHWVFTYNHSTYAKQFYANAVLQTAPASVQNIYQGSGQFNVGATYSAAASPANGRINVAKMYNRVLSAAEVLSNFNHYKTRFNIT